MVTAEESCAGTGSTAQPMRVRHLEWEGDGRREGAKQQLSPTEIGNRGALAAKKNREI